MKTLLKIAGLAMIIATTSVTVADTVNLINDSACLIDASNNVWKTTHTTMLYSYNLANPNDPYTIYQDEPINPRGKGTIVNGSYEGEAYSGVIVGPSEDNLTISEGVDANVTYYVITVDLDSDYLYALVPFDPCASLTSAAHNSKVAKIPMHFKRFIK